MSERNRKKPLYFGDPNATMTICVKKMRRHHRGDLQLIFLPNIDGAAIPADATTLQDATKQADPAKPTYFFICRHCKDNPFITTLDATKTPSVQ